MENIKNIKLFLLDMDGTLYLGDQLFDGTIDFLRHVQADGGRYIFLTNNSSKGVEQYIEKLAKLGIPAVREDFLTSVDATIPVLRAEKYRKIYALGTTSFKKQLREEELPITDVLSDDIDCLCMGFDTELTFQKLEDACILLNRDIAYIATNPDWVCPTPFGSVPDCGSISQILQTATGRLPRFIGKPGAAMAELAMQRTGYCKAETAIVGDRLYTDIACGINAGIQSIFVLSGEGTMEDIEKTGVTPTFIFEDIQEIYRQLTQ